MKIKTILVVIIILISQNYLFAEDKNKDINPKAEKSNEVKDKKRMIILDFVNHSSDPDFNYLEKTIPETINAKLNQAKNLIIESRAKGYNVIKKLGINKNEINQDLNMIKIGEALKCHIVVSGSFNIKGKMLIIDFKAIDVISGMLHSQQRFQGLIGDKIFDLIDNVSRQVSDKLIEEFTPEPPRYRIIEKTVSTDIRNPQFLVPEIKPSFGAIIDFNLTLSPLNTVTESYYKDTYPEKEIFSGEKSDFKDIDSLNYGISLGLYWNFLMGIFEYSNHGKSGYESQLDYQEGTPYTKVKGDLKINKMDIKIGYRTFNDPGFDFSLTYLSIRNSKFTFTDNSNFSGWGAGAGYLTWNSYDVNHDLIRILSRFDFFTGIYLPFAIKREYGDLMEESSNPLSRTGGYLSTKLGMGIAIEKYGFFSLISGKLDADFLYNELDPKNVTLDNPDDKKIKSKLGHLTLGIEFSIGFYYDSEAFLGE